MERRASILKRKSLNQSVTNESIPDIPIMNKDAKRVSFHSSNFVKPFATDPEKNTIWDSTYEEAVNNTDSTKSNENTDTKMSQISRASAFHIYELEDWPDKSNAKVKITTQIEEHDKENVCGDNTTMSSLIAQETVIDEVKQSKCFPLKENNTVDFTCIYANRPIQENTAKNKNIDLPVLELIVQEVAGSENIPSGIKDNLETTSMELTSVLSTDILCSHRFVERDQDLKVSNQEHNEERLLNFSSTDEYTYAHNFTLAMDFTCAPLDKQDISSDIDITCSPSNKQNITSTSAMNFTCAPNNKEYITSVVDFDSKELTESASDIKNDSFDYTGVQNINSSIDLTCAPSNKEDISSVMDITCASNNTENVSSAMNVTSAAFNKQCNTSKTELTNLDRKVKTKMGIFKDSKLEIDITTDSLSNKPVGNIQEEFSFKINKQITHPKIESGSNFVQTLNEELSSINQLPKSFTEQTYLIIDKSNIRSDSEILNNSTQVLDSQKREYRTRAKSKIQVTLPLADSKGTNKLTEVIVSTNEPIDVSIIPETEKNVSCRTKAQNHAKTKLPETILKDSRRKTSMITKLETSGNISKSNTNHRELTFSKPPNRLEQTYTVKKWVNLTDASNDFCLKSDTELILTPNIPKDLQFVNTFATSFCKSLGIDQPDRPSYAVNSKGQCLNQQEYAEVSSYKELAPANPTLEHCNDDSLTDILESNTDCTLFDTTPLLDDDLDRSTENDAMKNKFASLQDSVYKDKIEIVENSTDTRDQKSLDDIKVTNTTDLLLERRGSRFVQKIINGPQTVFDNTPVNKDLLTKLEETHKRVKSLLENFKMPEILIINLAELEKLENEYGESSNSKLSDGFLGTISGDNSAEDADLEIPSLEERLQEQAKRSIKYWQFVKCVNNDCYCFYTLYKCAPFKVYIDPNSGIVREIETFNNLKDNALPSYVYETRYMQEKLKKDNLLLALGSAYDILTLLDYVVMVMEEIKAFDKEYDKLEDDFGREHHLTMNPDFSVTIQLFKVEFLLWWEITVDLSINHLGCITSVKAHHHESTDEPVNEEIIQKIAMNTEGPLFIRNFIIGINNYVNREGPKRLAQRKENLKEKYNFLTFK